MGTDQEEPIELTEEFRQEAIEAAKSLGLPEDEAEMMVDDYYGIY